MIYHVGQRVIIRKDLHKGIMCKSRVVGGMLQYAGQIVTIKRIINDVYYIKEDPKKWSWNQEMFEKTKLTKIEQLKKKLLKEA